MRSTVTGTIWRLPAILLPDGERRDLWVTPGGRLTDAAPRRGSGPAAVPAHGAAPGQALPGRFALPGLVDSHIHVTIRNGGPVGIPEAEETLRALPSTGVLLVRDAGSPGSVTLRLTPAPDRPRLIAAGRFLAPQGRMLAAYHDPVTPETLIPAALAEIAAGARWVKVTADWDRDQPLNWEPAVLRALVDAVHAAGARVAAHTQWAGVAAVVAAGIDSIEHGCSLDADTVATMAARGTAWTPTLTAFNKPFTPDLPVDVREFWEDIRANMREQLPRAVAAGVTILAGTDNDGSLLDEIRHLVGHGLTPTQALRAASTHARTYLGLPGFAAGELADVVTFDADPREDPEVLANPVAVVMRGVRIK